MLEFAEKAFKLLQKIFRRILSKTYHIKNTLNSCEEFEIQ